METPGIKLLTGINCFQCGYNMAGSNNWICPECGTQIQPREVKKYKLTQWYLKNKKTGQLWSALCYVPILILIGATFPILPGLSVFISLPLICVMGGRIFLISKPQTPAIKAMVRGLIARTSYLLIMPMAMIYLSILLFPFLLVLFSISKVSLLILFVSLIIYDLYTIYLSITGYRIWLKIWNRLAIDTIWTMDDSSIPYAETGKIIAGMHVAVIILPVMFITIFGFLNILSDHIYLHFYR